MSGTKKRAAMLILVGPNPGCRRDWVNGRLVRGQSAQTHPDESTLRMPPALGLLSCRSTVSPRAAARRAAGRFEHARSDVVLLHGDEVSLDQPVCLRRVFWITGVGHGVNGASLPGVQFNIHVVDIPRGLP